MNVYVVGSTREIERIQTMQQTVRRLGGNIVFDWTGAEGEIRTDGSWSTVPERGAQISIREIRACQDADLIILLSPPVGRGLGCWIEMGAGLASGADVWVVGAQRDSVFWQHPAVTSMAFDADVRTALSLRLAFHCAAADGYGNYAHKGKYPRCRVQCEHCQVIQHPKPYTD